jgi:Arylsulfotransferase (ASST)
MTTTDRPQPEHPPEDPKRPGISRRQFLPRAIGGAAGLVAAGVVGYEVHPAKAAGPAAPTATEPTTTPATPAASPSSAEMQSFVTRPDLTPPAVKVAPISSASAYSAFPGYILLSVNNVIQGGPVQQGLMIIDREGRLVWFEPVTAANVKPFDLNAQIDGGKPVLTWWQGHLVGSHGAGTGMVVDGAYTAQPSVQAGGGLQMDLHEFNITAKGTALITAYEQVNTSYKPLGGRGSGPVYAPHAQEIDLTTGKVLFDWNSLDHVSIAESFLGLPAKGNVLDYIHLNSVAETTDGNLLISGRNTSAVYKVDRGSGEVIWRLGGKKSDFQLPHDARFYWQHHARAWSDTEYTVFDNGAHREEKRSRGLLLSVNESARTVALTRAYLHPAAFISNALGSVSLLPDGRVFVGWGDQPYFSEFASDGTLLLDGQLPIGVRSYRAYTANWVGRPTTKPRIVAKANPAGGFVVRASWNGATEIDQWQVLGGASGSSLDPIGAQRWTGFETAIAVNSAGPAFCAVALDSSGRELGRSEVV